MATTTGKAARRRLGTRYAAKRRSRHTNPEKKARWIAREKQRNKGRKQNRLFDLGDE